MTEYLLLANPIALAALFFYQHYRLKLLSSSLQEQKRLISETKDVVTQQATAISSQATVVDTAIRYTQAFDPKKIEELMRRELGLEFASEKRELQEQIQLMKGQHAESAAKNFESAALAASQKLLNLFSPILLEYVVFLYFADPERREKSIAGIDNDEARSMVETILKNVSTRLSTENIKPAIE